MRAAIYLICVPQCRPAEATKKRIANSGQNQIFCLTKCKWKVLFDEQWAEWNILFTYPTTQADFLTRSHSMIKSKRKIVKNTNLMDEDMVRPVAL